MRKLILISAFVLASASAQAFDIGSLIPSNDTPSGKQASSRSRKAQAQPRETHEQKARQIGAQYGISW